MPVQVQAFAGLLEEHYKARQAAGAEAGEGWAGRLGGGEGELGAGLGWDPEAVMVLAERLDFRRPQAGSLGALRALLASEGVRAGGLRA
jgi:gamma-tubulin complex component 2